MIAAVLCPAWSFADITTEIATADTVYTRVDQMPQFKGDVSSDSFRNWVLSEVTFSRHRDNSKAFSSMVRFVVRKDGSVGEVEMLHPSDSLMAVRVKQVVEQSPRWTPGVNGGDTVNVSLTIPLDMDAATFVRYVVSKPAFNGDTSITAFRRWVVANTDMETITGKNGKMPRKKFIATFVVDDKGNVGDITVYESPSAKISEAVSQTILSSAPHWTPAFHNGRMIANTVSLEINFRDFENINEILQ